MGICLVKDIPNRYDCSDPNNMDEDGRLIMAKKETPKAELEPIVLDEQITETDTTVIAPSKDIPFEKHVYDCPSCKKKIRVHLGNCGCPKADNIYTWTLKHGLV